MASLGEVSADTGDIELRTAPRIGLGTNILYAGGAAATSIKGKIMGTFLLIYYNQVVGLSPALVGTAIMIAMIFDAIVDPIIGQWSDMARSRWGRRHPFMYAAIVPTAVGFFLLWNPPTGLEGAQIFYYLLFFLIFVRIFDTFFEVPSSALAPELAKDYESRTTIYSLRTGFSVAAGYLIILAAYQVFMPEKSDGSGGITDRDGYYLYTLVAAGLIAVIMLVSSIGTHKLIPYLDKAPKKHASFGEALGVIRKTLSSHAFVIMAVSGMLYSIAIGVRHAAELYFYLFFWEFDQTQIALLTVLSVPCVFAGATLAPVAGKRLGKKKAALIALTGALLITSTPPLLRILGLLPDNSDPLIFWIILVETVITQVMSVTHAVLASSMLADVVEEAAVKTGQRSEGLILSAENLFKKMVSGLGTFAGGMLLAFVHFPDDAKKVGVSAKVIWDFGAVYLPVFAVPFLGAIIFLSMFRIDRARHESNLAELEAAAIAEDAVEEETGTR